MPKKQRRQDTGLSHFISNSNHSLFFILFSPCNHLYYTYFLLFPIILLLLSTPFLWPSKFVSRYRIKHLLQTYEDYERLIKFTRFAPPLFTLKTKAYPIAILPFLYSYYTLHLPVVYLSSFLIFIFNILLYTFACDPKVRSFCNSRN